MPSCRGVVANNCTRYGYIVSRSGGVCAVIGGAVANNCARYGYIVSHGGGVRLVVGV